MKSWPAPTLPVLPGASADPRVHDTASGAEVVLSPEGDARMYVCGITPYDATHMGHAATYVTFDLLLRVLRDTGRDVVYAQNITDVDDPLLERAARDGIDWTDLATREIDLFREDMTALRVVPPRHYIGVVESIDWIEASVGRLLDAGAAYRLAVDPADPASPASPSDASSEASAGDDIYLDLTRRDDFGAVCGWTTAQMDAVFVERGGDPDRPGKRDRFDPLLWRARRDGEPSWPSIQLGAGRPGWHIECTSIALETLGMGFDVQGGGTDLIFPHHEMSAVQADALTGERPFATAYVHQAMVGLGGEKMSKSKGNLVLVSALRRHGVDPMAIRLALLAHHYRTPWEWTDAVLATAVRRLADWRAALASAVADSGPTDGDSAGEHRDGDGAGERRDGSPVREALRYALGSDLDSPAALVMVDAWAARVLGGRHLTSAEADDVASAIDALLGVAL